MIARALFVLALALAGCGSDEVSSAADMSSGDLAVRVCPTSCTSCAAGQVCVTHGGGPVQFGASCLKPCTGGGPVECPHAFCVEIIGASPPGRYCVSTGAPDPCNSPQCNSTPAGDAHCEGDEIVSPFGLNVCGYEHTTCANGCSTTPVDGFVGPYCL
ncbi:MAG: hypothetical protein ACXVDD_00940 [Polyangia bacterium]